MAKGGGVFHRIGKIFKGFLSLFVKGLEQSNPHALLEAQKEELREKISQFNQSLAKQAASVAKLERMVSEGTKSEQMLLAKAQAHLTAGNRDAAGQLALQLKNLKDQLAGHKEMLEGHRATYADLVKTKEITIREAKMKLETLTQKLSQVEMKEAEAELREMSSAMIGELGAGGDTMNRLEEQLNERLEYATGRASVARDSTDLSEVKLKESEIKALESQALAELSASLGIEYKSDIAIAGAPLTESASVTETPSESGKIMGPAEMI